MLYGLYRIEKRNPERNEAMLKWLKKKNMEESRIFNEFCECLEINLTGNNGVYEANLNREQADRLRTSILVNKIYLIG